MFGTRLAEVSCAVIEVALIVFKTFELVCVCCLIKDISVQCDEIARLIQGLVSTLFFGVVFSPEANFKVHVKLSLVVENLTKESHHKLAEQLAEELSTEVVKARNERFAHIEATQQELEVGVIKSRLGELLYF
jgi:hypothetical protein